MMRIRRLVKGGLAMPGQIWGWSQRDPYQAIGIGTMVLFLALAAKLILAAVAGVAIVGGLYRIYLPGVE